MSNIDLQKFLKLGRFFGSPRLNGPPIFVNSMPKAGTNLLENLLVSLGYKRNFSRCLNESNMSRTSINPRQGRFYIGHITEDKLIHSAGFCTIYLKRDLWSCLKSYVNYMYIDKGHPVSRFLRRSPKLETVQSLFLTKNNPNGRPLIDEYLRFHRLNLGNYQLCVEFNDLIAHDTELIKVIARTLELSENHIREHLIRSHEAESYTKNVGRIDIFGNFDERDVKVLQQHVVVAEIHAIETS